MPSPGPILLIVAATAVKFVVKSKLSSEISRTESANTIRYDAIKTLMERTTVCSITLPSIFSFFTLCGCTMTSSSFCTDLNSTTIRDTLIPPPVLPAQAPINMSSTRIDWENDGHRLKSAVANPVVVITEPT